MFPIADSDFSVYDNKLDAPGILMGLCEGAFVNNLLRVKQG